MLTQGPRPVLERLHGYLLEIRAQMLPKSEPGAAVNYILKELDGTDALLREPGLGDRQ